MDISVSCSLCVCFVSVLSNVGIPAFASPPSIIQQELGQASYVRRKDRNELNSTDFFQPVILLCYDGCLYQTIIVGGALYACGGWGSWL